MKHTYGANGNESVDPAVLLKLEEARWFPDRSMTKKGKRKANE